MMDYLLGAIQLRPFLMKLYRAKGSCNLNGEDVQNFARSGAEQLNLGPRTGVAAISAFHCQKNLLIRSQ
jgi:hypothetical protein